MKKHFKTVVHQVEVLGDAGWLGNIIIEDMGLRVETLLKNTESLTVDAADHNACPEHEYSYTLVMCSAAHIK
jgi:hypothetical protein